MEDQDSTVKDTLKKIIGDKKDGGIPINEKGKWLDKKQRFDFTLQGYKFKVYSNNKITNEQFKTSVYKGYKQDKIEMRGDRAEMSDFPLYLNTVAGGLDRRDQTIGGFSFVVKIYAVPVV